MQPLSPRRRRVERSSRTTTCCSSYEAIHSRRAGKTGSSSAAEAAASVATPPPPPPLPLARRAPKTTQGAVAGVLFGLLVRAAADEARAAREQRQHRTKQGASQDEQHLSRRCLASERRNGRACIGSRAKGMRCARCHRLPNRRVWARAALEQQCRALADAPGVLSDRLGPWPEPASLFDEEQARDATDARAEVRAGVGCHATGRGVLEGGRGALQQQATALREACSKARGQRPRQLRRWRRIIDRLRQTGSSMQECV